MPAPPRWLLAVPDAIRQLEALDRDLLTRRDVERLFGVSRARAAQLMRTFGAELVGASRVLRRTELLRQLRKYRQRAAFRGEEERRTRLVAELRQARLTGIRVAVPRRGARGAPVRPARGRVGRARADRGALQRGAGRRRAPLRARPGADERLRAVRGARRGGRGGRRRGSGEGMSDDVVRVAPSDALRPARAQRAELALPPLIVDAGPVAMARFLEFFAARIARDADGDGLLPASDCEQVRVQQERSRCHHRSTLESVREV